MPLTYTIARTFISDWPFVVSRACWTTLKFSKPNFIIEIDGEKSQ